MLNGARLQQQSAARPHHLRRHQGRHAVRVRRRTKRRTNPSCVDEACTKKWPPFLAPATAKASGDWTLVTRPDGAKQWAFRGKPLYTNADDSAGRSPTGAAAAVGARPNFVTSTNGHDVDGRQVVEIRPDTWMSLPAGIGAGSPHRARSGAGQPSGPRALHAHGQNRRRPWRRLGSPSKRRRFPCPSAISPSSPARTASISGPTRAARFTPIGATSIPPIPTASTPAPRSRSPSSCAYFTPARHHHAQEPCLRRSAHHHRATDHLRARERHRRRRRRAARRARQSQHRHDHRPHGLRRGLRKTVAADPGARRCHAPMVIGASTIAPTARSSGPTTAMRSTPWLAKRPERWTAT